MIHLRVFLVLVAFTLLGCEGEVDIDKMLEGERMKKLSEEQISSLLSRKIFFGHMSVGFNIIEGISDMQKEDSRLGALKLIEMDDTSLIESPGIYHKRVGKNRFPELKCDDFTGTLEGNELGLEFDVAMLKLCYVDFNEDTDVTALFGYYEKKIEDLRQKFPHLKFVHITAPLSVHSSGIKSWIKNLLKGDIRNYKRAQYNNILRERYMGIDPIYDLAKIESTHHDGSDEFYIYDGKKIPSLIESYTYDGGHLNQLGRYKAAKDMLSMLSEIKL